MLDQQCAQQRARGEKAEVEELKGIVAGLKETMDEMARHHASQMAVVVRVLGDFQERFAALGVTLLDHVKHVFAPTK